MDHTPGSSSKYMTTIYNYFCKKNDIFRLFESKKFMEICSQTHQIAPFPPKNFGEACPRTPEQTLGYATRRKPPPPPPQKKIVCPFGKSCIRP